MPAHILAVTVIPAALCLTIAIALRGQGGRRTTGMVRPDAPYMNPLTPRERAAIRHYALLDLKGRTLYVNTVNSEVTQ
ncbi:hypothetical protein [Micromonospora maritima]|uniref:hypothetical protein n=1 Tax=Micromonospora maritima TaxID=986711 RepID=UPI00157E01F6|nr:hypothetical protein [Micromonospora maritima]